MQCSVTKQLQGVNTKNSMLALVFFQVSSTTRQSVLQSDSVDMLDRKIVDRFKTELK